MRNKKHEEKIEASKNDEPKKEKPPDEGASSESMIEGILREKEV